MLFNVTLQGKSTTPGGAATSTVVVSNVAALASYVPSQRMYYSGMIFPAFSYDSSRGALVLEHRGPALLFASLFMALVWGTLAMVFIVPSWAGVMVTNVSKIFGVLYVSYVLLQLRLLLSVLDILDGSLHLALEHLDVAKTKSLANGSDEVPPEALSFRALYSSRSHDLRSSSLFIKASAFMMRWRTQLVFPACSETISIRRRCVDE